MGIYVRNIVFSSSDAESLGQFYARLLGMKVLRTDWFVVGHDTETFPRLAFDTDPQYRPPVWEDPDRPQQLHLDIPVFDLKECEQMVISLGGVKIADRETFRIYADPDGHPFCLFTDHGFKRPDERLLPGVIGNIVFDCLSPRTLARFYGSLLHLPLTREDSPQWVMIAKDEDSLPRLAFQHAVVSPPHWPDPRYPQQIHLDFDVELGGEARRLALDLGAVPLPPMGGSCPVFADPAGHPFCLCGPGE